MDFRDFIYALYSVNGESVSNSNIRKFLGEITDEQFKEELDAMSDSKIASSYRKERKTFSKPFANEILARYNRKYLIKYFKEESHYDSKYKQKLCDAFKEYCPDINMKNVLTLVAEQFEECLNSACKGNANKKISLSRENLKSISELVVELHCIAEKIENNLLENEKIQKQFWMLPLSSKNSKLEQLQEDFHKKNMELHLYTKNYPELTIIDEVIAEADVIENRLPTKTAIQGIVYNVNENIKEYKCLLDELIKIIYNK